MSTNPASGPLGAGTRQWNVIDADGRPQDPDDTNLTPDDLAISAQARATDDLDRMLDQLSRLLVSSPATLLDVGCGLGALSERIARRLGSGRVIGVDCDARRLEVAASRGLETHVVDLNQGRVPLPSGSVDLVTCFGVLAYLTTYDACLSEAARVLHDQGWLMLSMPNLASWRNRLSLLFGYQPAHVAVSAAQRRAGTLQARKHRVGRQAMPPALHAATLRCIRELLDNFGFDVVVVRGFKPGASLGLAHRLGARVPSLSRRFLILARKRPIAGSAS